MDRLIALERPKVNLIIYNLSASSASLPYSITFNNNGNITSYFTSIEQKIAIGSTHSILLNLNNSSTIIGVEIDTTNVSVSSHNIYSGATGVTPFAFIDNTLSFTLSTGFDNIQIGFVVYQS